MSPIPTNPDGTPAGPKPPNPPTSASGVSGEPVGPYAPTRDGRTINQRYEDDPGLFEAGYRQGWRERNILGEPRYPDLAVDRVDALARDAQAAAKDDRPLREWLAEQFATANSGHVSIATRIDGLVDVVLRQEQRLTERMATLNPTVTSQQAIDDAFERGRQQGDTDRAARAQAEYDRGVAAGRASVNSAMDADYAEVRARSFEAGAKIGASEREAELLEQGWTPPESMMVTVARIEDEDAYLRGQKMGMEVARAHGEGGPTDYEVWRDALNMAVTRNGLDGGRTEIQEDADFFRDQLKNYPTDIPDEIGPNDAEDEWEAKTFPAGRIDGE